MSSRQGNCTNTSGGTSSQTRTDARVIENIVPIATASQKTTSSVRSVTVRRRKFTAGDDGRTAQREPLRDADLKRHAIPRPFDRSVESPAKWQPLPRRHEMPMEVVPVLREHCAPDEMELRDGGNEIEGGQAGGEQAWREEGSAGVNARATRQQQIHDVREEQRTQDQCCRRMTHRQQSRENGNRRQPYRSCRAQPAVQGPEHACAECDAREFRIRASHEEVDQQIGRERKCERATGRRQATETPKREIHKSRRDPPQQQNRHLQRERERGNREIDRLDDVKQSRLIEVEERLTMAFAYPFDPPHRELPFPERAIEEVCIGEVGRRIMAGWKAATGEDRKDQCQQGRRGDNQGRDILACGRTRMRHLLSTATFAPDQSSNLIKSVILTRPR